MKRILASVLLAGALLMTGCGRIGLNLSQKFDGHVLYDDAFDKLMHYHILLRDQNSQFVKDWAATWQHKHDHDTVLNTEDGADTAVAEMMASLGQRFDYYFLPAQTQQEQQQVDPTTIGIGALVRQTGVEDYLKAEVAKLPKTATRAEKQIAGRHIQEGLEQLKLGPSNAVEVIQPVPGGAAEAAGVKAGDHIVAVGGVSVNGLTLNQVVGKLHGKEGASVAVTVERKDASGKYVPVNPITVLRKAYVTPDAHAKDMGDGIGYIKLDDFESKFEIKEMRDALKKDAAGKFVILDLRGNPGGLTTNGIAMAQLFLRDGIILERHQRDGDDIITKREDVLPEFAEEITISSADPDHVNIKRSDRYSEVLPEDMPIVVLVDGNTYSCAEILSGTLQFNHRAVVVGEPTGGKGVEQTVIDLAYGRRMHITSAEFMPAGMPHQTDWIGIIPDYIVAQPQPDAKALPGTQPVDAQLEAAKKVGLELVSQRDARKKQADALKQKHHDDFKKAQQN